MTPVAHEDDLACHASLPQQLVSVSCLDEGKSMRDERLDPLLFKEVEQGDQILSKQFRSQSFKPLDAVGDHPFPAREKPSASDIQSEDRDSMKAMATRPIAPHVARTIGHYLPAGTESLAGTPDVATTDPVKDNVYALARE
jgi:hypothetical protein